MSAASIPNAPIVVKRSKRPLCGGFGRVLRRNPLAMVGAALIVLLVFCALFGPLIAPHDPADIDLAARLQAPSTTHWFGTDELGRDIFSRILYGARISMIVGLSVVSGSLALGTLVG